ncbi:MAG: hypothetical protein ACERKT_00780, partial [Acidobacteriota bacterium]
RSRDADPDEIGCGSDFDSLLADSLDVFSVTCESNSTGARITTSKAKLNSKGKGKAKVKCPAAEGIDCQVKIVAKKGKKTLAKGSGKVKSGESKKVTLKLTKAGKKQSSNKLKTKAKTTMTDAAGAKVSTSRNLVLKR